MAISTRRPVVTGDLRVDADLRRQLVRSMALPVGSLSAFGLAVALVPVRQHVHMPAVVVPFVAVVLVTALVGGRVAGAYCATVSAFAVDAFLRPPYPVVTFDAEFWLTLAALAAVALLVRPRRPGR